MSCVGMKAKDLKIEAQSYGSLLVHGVNKMRSMRHELRMPKNADFTSATALCADGMLTVTVPKTRPAEPTRVELNATPDVAPKSGAYNLTVAAPGVSASDIAVLIDGCGLLSMSGYTEKTGARLAREYRLPRDAD